MPRKFRTTKQGHAGLHEPCLLGFFIINKDEYDMISEGLPKYFLGSLLQLIL